MEVIKKRFILVFAMLILFTSMLTGCNSKTTGNAWLVDSFEPTSNTNGNDGDMYLDTSTYDLYQMKNNQWIKIGNIKGDNGSNGINGTNGENGLSPSVTISTDGYWIINGEKTKIKAQSQDGADGKDGVDGKDGADGKDGVDGKDGITPTIEISEDGYWIINGEKTTIDAICKNCIKIYEESKNIEIPDLYNYTLTPIKYNGNDWVVADITKEWYSYNNQEWANAVVLNDNVTKNVGDVVTVEGTNPDAIAMYVWIPRYEYKIDGSYGKSGLSSQLPGEIEVNFISTYQTENTDGYIIHPAFNFDGKELSGIWVGKFEVSHATKTNEALNCSDKNCEEGNDLRILPNVQSLRNNNVSNLFYAIKSMEKKHNLSSIADTHMIKNSEWGAVAYLSQSKYGKYGNDDYQAEEKEVYLNNSTSYYTGRSGGSYGGNTPIKSAYKDKSIDTQYISTGFYTYDGYLLNYGTNEKSSDRNMNTVASTTGNIYGVYDMSGSAYEYVMGIFVNSNNELWSGSTESSNSGFKGKVGLDGIPVDGAEWPKSKYYNTYKATDGVNISSKTQCNGGWCYGHAIRETINWYKDYLLSIKADNPWFLRGGLNSEGAYAGIFYANGHTGAGGNAISTRVVLASNK